VIATYQRRHSALKVLPRDADEIDSQAATNSKLSDHHLREPLFEFRDKFRRGGRNVNAVVLPALAAIREVADRQLGLRPFRVQLMGALALHRGYQAEMATGEGKTLT